MNVFTFLFSTLAVFVLLQDTTTGAAPNVEQGVFATDPRIINGTDAARNNTMHQASLRRRLSDSYFFGTGHICGGSLISYTVVVSAAHCFVDFNSENYTYITARDFIVVMGNLDRFEKNNYTLTYDITHVVFRTPQFNISSYYRDISLIFLNGTVPANHPTVHPIALNWKPVTPGSICQITGWGRTEQGYLSDVLKTLDVPIISKVVCDTQTGFDPGYILDGMMCAGYMEGERDACDGDSGGPMVCNGTLAGITSWGDGCAKPKLPGVYTDVSFYAPWIRLTVVEAGGNLEGSAMSCYKGSLMMLISLATIATWLGGTFTH